MKVSLTMTKRFIARKKRKKIVNERGTEINARKYGRI